MIQRNIYETKEDWLKWRKGLFTASQISKLMTASKAKYRPYILECIADKLAPGEPEYYSQAMQHGVDTEPQAVLKYAEVKGLDVNADDFIYTSVGGWVFFTHHHFNIGGTPDIILPDRICEIKCPSSKQHIDYLLCDNGLDLPTDYYYQMQLNMYLAQRWKCDFISFDDRLHDDKLHIKIIEIERDEDVINKLLEAAGKAKHAMEVLLKILQQ